MNETTPHDVCSVCEKAFERSDLEYVALRNDPKGYARPHDPAPFWACAPCTTREKLNFYHTRWLEGGANQERLLIENNLFRTMMMSNEVITKLANEPSTAVRSYLLQHQSGWETLPLDAMIMFLSLLSAHAEFFASMLNKKASQDEIRASLTKKTEAAKVSHKKQVIAQKAAETGLRGTYTKDEIKAVKSMMKQMRCSEEKAYTLITGGIKTMMAQNDVKVLDKG